MSNIYIIGGVVAALIFLGIIFVMSYIKAPPDTAYIISGIRKMPRYIIGKAGIRIPFLERFDILSLKLIKIDVKTKQSIPTADYINVTVDANVNVKISNNEKLLPIAAQNFLNKDTSYIAGVVNEVLEGNMREIVGKMKLTDMIGDRKAFAQQVTENVTPDLAAMGLDLVSFNVQNFEDDNDVIVNLGIDNIVAIKKQAAISKAQAEKDIKVAQAVAKKEANDAEVKTETTIAERNNELEIKKANLKKEADNQKAIADAAYEIQKQKERDKREKDNDEHIKAIFKMLSSSF